MKTIDVKTYNNTMVLADDDLEQRKEEACQDIYYYVDPTDFKEPYSLEITNLINEYVTKIGFANESDTINDLVEEFRARIDWLINSISEYSEDDIELENAKEDAIDYISYYLRCNSDIYYVFEEEIDIFLEELRANIYDASSLDEVKDLLKQFDQKMAEYPSDPDVYLVQLKYDLRESFIDYLGTTCYELGIYISEDDFDWLLECLDDEIRHLNSRQKIMERYYGMLNFAYEFIIESANDRIFNNNNDNGKTALIVICSVEGVIILAVASLVLILLIKKKKLINK